VANRHRPPAAADRGGDRSADARAHTAPGPPQLHNKDHEVQQLYEEIMREADPALWP